MNFSVSSSQPPVCYLANYSSLWTISSCLWQTLLCCNCFFFGILHLSPGLWKFYHRTVFQMLLSVITDTSPVQAKFYISFSASISPHQVEGKVHSSAMAGPDLGLSWFRGLFSPGASGRELLTASLGLSAKFCSPFHCGDIFARVLNRVLILPCLLSWSQDHASLCIRKAVDICQLCFFFFFLWQESLPFIRFLK